MVFSFLCASFAVVGLVDLIAAGAFWMRDFQGTPYTQGMHSIKTFMRGITSLRHHLFLAFGLNQGEIMMKNMHMLGNRGDMRSHTLIHFMRLIDFVKQISIERLMLSMMVINFVIAIAVLMATVMLIAIVIMGLIGLPGSGDVIVVILAVMILTIGIVFPIKAGRAVVREIMIMVAITMILTMREIRENQEKVVGEGVSPAIVNGIREP